MDPRAVLNANGYLEEYDGLIKCAMGSRKSVGSSGEAILAGLASLQFMLEEVEIKEEDVVMVIDNKRGMVDGKNRNKLGAANVEKQDLFGKKDTAKYSNNKATKRLDGIKSALMEALVQEKTLEYLSTISGLS
ncbi:hypothetical protein PIB30_069570 [Stylosanthes scabra]|uniref:RNase H type-1 domain-containing protein n=1 Tax=Stylosanthes scabra TaxID=79078 RepID=A0ABU6YLD1_9FABA|nr:hypothetical protein [Stylosanthes scabra]